MLPTTATIVYSASPTNVSAAVLSAAMQGVVLYSSALTDPVINGLYGCTIGSDTPTVGPPCLRTIVIDLAAPFFVLFPSAASWVGAFPGLYKFTLQNALVAIVNEVSIVFA